MIWVPDRRILRPQLVASPYRRRHLGGGSAHYDATVLGDSPLYFWKLNGNNLADYGSAGVSLQAASGFSLPSFSSTGGPLSDGYANCDSARGQALDSVSNASATLNNHALSIEMLVNPLDVNTHSGFFMQLGNAAGQVYFYMDANIFTEEGAAQLDLGANGLTVATWQHIVLTRSVAAGTSTFIYYLNGSSRSTGTLTTATNNFDSFPVQISHGTGNINPGWPGAGLAQGRIAVYTTALSAARIAAHYAAFLGGHP